MKKIVTEQERIEKIRSSTEEVKELYSSDELVSKIELVIGRFSITKPFRTIGEIVGDTILGFYKLHEMPELFVSELGVTKEIAQKMTSELVEFLDPVLKREEELAEHKKTDLQKLAESFAEKSRRAQERTQDSTQPPSAPLSDTEEAVPEVHEKLEPMRTMKGDIGRIHGYGAYYEALEKGEIVHSSEQDTILPPKK